MHWLRSLFGRERREQEFDRELQFHIEAVTREFEAKGLTPAEGALEGDAGVRRKGADGTRAA